MVSHDSLERGRGYAIGEGGGAMLLERGEGLCYWRGGRGYAIT